MKAALTPNTVCQYVADPSMNVLQFLYATQYIILTLSVSFPNVSKVPLEIQMIKPRLCFQEIDNTTRFQKP